MYDLDLKKIKKQINEEKPSFAAIVFLMFFLPFFLPSTDNNPVINYIFFYNLV